MFPRGDQVVVRRGGAVVATLLCGWDPAEHKLYADFNADVQQGDVLTFRGVNRRVIAEPERWRNPWTGWEAGAVILVEDAPPHLPDLGRLERATGEAFDRVTNRQVTTWQVLWTGACLADPPTTPGTEAEAGQQRLTLQPFEVSVPLEVTDIRPGDRFTVLASADARLVDRPVTVTRVRGGSLAQVRVFTVIDNQG